MIVARSKMFFTLWPLNSVHLTCQSNTIIITGIQNYRDHRKPEQQSSEKGRLNNETDRAAGWMNHKFQDYAAWEGFSIDLESHDRNDWYLSKAVLTARLRFLLPITRLLDGCYIAIIIGYPFHISEPLRVIQFSDRVSARACYFANYFERVCLENCYFDRSNHLRLSVIPCNWLYWYTLVQSPSFLKNEYLETIYMLIISIILKYNIHRYGHQGTAIFLLKYQVHCLLYVTLLDRDRDKFEISEIQMTRKTIFTKVTTRKDIKIIVFACLAISLIKKQYLPIAREVPVKFTT